MRLLQIGDRKKQKINGQLHLLEVSQSVVSKTCTGCAYSEKEEGELVCANIEYDGLECASHDVIWKDLGIIINDEDNIEGIL